MHNKNKRVTARRLFHEDGLCLADISERLSVPVNTIRNWKADDKANGLPWDRAARMESLKALFIRYHEDALQETVADGELTAMEKAERIAHLAELHRKVYGKNSERSNSHG